MPSRTSPNDLLSITTFNNTEENLTICDKSEHLQYIPKGTVATDVDDKEDNLVKDQIKDCDIHNEETYHSDNNTTQHSLGKRKLIADESSIKIKKRRVTVDQNTMNQHNNAIENHETSNRDITNRNKTMETDRKRKKRLSINDTLKLENTNEGTVKKDPRGLAVKLDKNIYNRSVICR